MRMTASENGRHRRLVRLHEAKNARQLACAAFDLYRAELPQRALFLSLRPGEFELPSFCSEPELQEMFNRYIAGGHKHDIWLKRSPISPAVRAVRHSDYTPIPLLKRTRFFRDVIGAAGCEGGASITAWRDGAWLATLTAIRTPAQGDFTDAHMAHLLNLQVHFESAVRRVAERHESRQGDNSLETFVWGLPTAAVVLRWDLRVLHHNAAAQDLAHLWRLGPRGRNLKASRFRMPDDILARIEEGRRRLPDVPSTRRNRPKILPMLHLRQPDVPGLLATVSFLPSKTLALTRGTFLVTFEHRAGGGVPPASDDAILRHLSRREREVARHAAQGADGKAIARSFGTRHSTVRLQLHHIYRKLGIRSRYELMALLHGTGQAAR
jgi:DNA-binding CsgD family transcriptional regulator/PAS domain-containing protein